MPELPEVESVRRQLRPLVVGRRILAVHACPQTRFADLDRAVGTSVASLRRRGKYLLAVLGGGTEPFELVAHLGMTGSIRLRGRDGWQPDRYVRATITLDDAVLDFRDVRRFGRLCVVPAGDYRAVPTLAMLGPEPLADDFGPGDLYRRLAASSAPVKPLLLSQRAVAGVGNIYADEALWRARISPRARRIGPARAERLWHALRAVLSEAVAREGTTFRDYRMVNGQAGRNAGFLQVYGKGGRPCPRCATPLRKDVVGGRGTTSCPRCQAR